MINYVGSSKRWLIRLLLMPAFLPLVPAPVHTGCGPFDSGFAGYSFFRPSVWVQERAFLPFYLGINDAVRYYRSVEQKKERDNVMEWTERVCREARPEDVYYLVYKADLLEIQLLRSAAATHKLPVPPGLTDNTFAEYLYAQRCLETIDYLAFAKKCEPWVTAPDPWTLPARDTVAMLALVREGRKAFRSTRSDYMRLRYAYQLVRLAHYAGQYEYTLELYDWLMPKIDPDRARMDDSLLPWWILGHYAGALHGLGRRVEASYHFARIFLHCPSRRESAYRSFDIRTDEEWKACLALCVDDRERATLYAIRGSAPDSRALEEMRHIYVLWPEGPWLEMLLVKELHELERDLLGLAFNDRAEQNRLRYHIPRDRAGAYAIELEAFVRQVLEEDRVPHRPLWLMALGYLQTLRGDYYAASRTFEKVVGQVSQPELREQLDAMQWALRISSWREVTPEIEDEVFAFVRENPVYRKYPDFQDFVADKMTWLYRRAGRPGLAFLCQHPWRDLLYDPKMELVDDILAAARNPRSRFVRWLTRDADGNSLEPRLLDVKATLYLQKNQLEAAWQVYQDIPRTRWDEFLQVEPFAVSFAERVHVPLSLDSASMYNRGELIKELLDLEYRSRAEPDRNARYFFRLGLAWYNMTYFGQAWKALDYYRSGASWSRLYETQLFPVPGREGIFNREYTDCNRALYYFEKARLQARSRESQAKAAFMAARCERNNYFTSPEYRPPPCDDCIPVLPPQFRTHYDLLRYYYSDTEFYRQAIEECSWFAAYARR